MGNDSEDRHDDFLNGRSGSDALSVTCVIIAAILIVFSIAFPAARTGLNIFAILLLAYALWRMSSKDVSARRAENESFLKALGPIGRWTRSPKAEWKEARTYKHVRCSSCGQKIRVPRGKGHLRVTCPKCGQKFEVKA